MSTKSSIEFDDKLGVHFYRECWEGTGVYLNLYGKNIIFDVSIGESGRTELTVRIPNEVWDLICKKNSKQIFGD